VNFYSVTENGSGRLVKIEIYEGQTPPQPQKFVIGDKTYFLFTYKGPLNEALWSKYFLLSEISPYKDENESVNSGSKNEKQIRIKKPNSN
jgi:hypothetical protein